MGKLRNIGTKKNAIVKLKVLVERKFRKSLGKKVTRDDGDEHLSDYYNVPEDVKEGHFAVVAEEDDEVKRFVVPLSYLTHPLFLMLLEQAADEYGFDHDGALTIPCHPSELQKILQDDQDHVVDDQQNVSRFGVKWDSCSETMVKSC